MRNFIISLLPIILVGIGLSEFACGITSLTEGYFHNDENDKSVGLKFFIIGIAIIILGLISFALLIQTDYLYAFHFFQQ